MCDDNLKNLIPWDVDEIRIGITGMGKMGNIHLQCLRQLAGGEHEDYYKGGVQIQLNKIRICGICDINPACLSEHPQILSFESLTKLIAQSEPHIMIIATPTLTHFELTKIALENNVHTLVEKPLVTRQSQIEYLADLAMQNGCRLVSGHVERYNPVSVKIVSLLQSGSMRPNSYSFIRTQKYEERIQDDIISDKIIHDIDLALYYFGPIIETAIKEIKKINGTIYEASIDTKHANGVKGNIFVSWLVDDNERKRQVNISCSGYEIFGDFAEKKLVIDSKNVECEVPGMVKPSNNQIKDELVDFVLHCSEQIPQKPVLPLISLDEIVQSVNLLEQIASLAGTN